MAKLERVDADGTWEGEELPGGAVVWGLVEPSADFLARAEATAQALDAEITRQDERHRAEVALRDRILRERAEAMVRDNATPAVDLAAIAPFFPDWKADAAYEAGEVLYYKGAVVEVTEAHVARADRTPPRDPGRYTERFNDDSR